MAKKDEQNDEVQEEVQADEQQAAAPEASEELDVDRAAQTVAAAPGAQEGKLFAILSYALNLVGLPFCIVPLITRNNEFALYHAKQSLMIWIGGVVVSVASTVLMAICIGIVLVPILAPIAFVFLLVVNIMGLVNAAKLETKPLPLIGKWGEQWFKGITKV